MKSRVVFSRQSDEWRTPQDLFDRLDAHYHFTLDAAANSENTKCKRWLGPGRRTWIEDFDTLGEDALRCTLGREVAFCNPPYSRAREFVRWAAEQPIATVVMLLPSRTDTRWFHDYIWRLDGGFRPHVAAIQFVKGRLKFDGATNGAPFPSLIVEFRR